MLIDVPFTGPPGVTKVRRSIVMTLGRRNAARCALALLVISLYLMLPWPTWGGEAPSAGYSWAGNGETAAGTIAGTPGVQPASALVPAPAPLPPTEVRPADNHPPEPIAPPPPAAERPSAADAATGSEAGQEYPVDLPTALRLANAENLQIALAREQVRQAWAELDAAHALWLPSLRAGGNYDKHEGQIQQVTGSVLDVSRNSFYAGMGAGVIGSSTASVPGLYASFQMSDAIFAPLAARQAVYAQQSAACVATNDVLLQVSLGYLELLRTAGNLAIALEAQRDAEELAVLTKNYATTGQGLPADADRASTEYSIRRENVFVAQEAVRVASARLAEVLRLDPRLILNPLDPTVVLIKLVKEDSPDGDLISLALRNRPELAEARYLVGVATERMRREQYAPLLPSIVIGTSYGDFGGGVGGAIDNSGGRLETDAIAFWQLRNLGLGDRAAQAEARSVVRQTQISQMASMDRVAREVVEAHIQLAARMREIPRLEEAVASAVASQKRNMQRIREAQGLPIEVLQSNQALAQARLEYLRALADYDAAQFRLYWAIGWPTKQDVAAGIPGGR